MSITLQDQVMESLICLAKELGLLFCGTTKGLLRVNVIRFVYIVKNGLKVDEIRLDTTVKILGESSG